MEKGDWKAGRLNRVGRMLLLVFGLVLGMLLILFIVQLSFNVKKSGSDQIAGTGTNLLAETDLTGTVKMINDSEMIVGGADRSDQTIKITGDTRYEMRNPRTFLYEQTEQKNINKGKLVYVELDTTSQDTAKTIKTDYLTNLGGRVKSKENNQITIVDYLDQEIVVDVDDATKIFQLGKPELLTIADIPLENNILIYSNELYESGRPISAEWVEVLEEFKPES
ncbi:MAG TPA: hypothetical protein PLZ62_00745 [bacterium]|nr:hypothetical protein [bacterium]